MSDTTQPTDRYESYRDDTLTCHLLEVPVEAKENGSKDPMTAIKVCLLWLVWCAVHSLLITVRAQQWIAEKGGMWQGFYRLGYVCFATVSLLLLFGYTASLPQHRIPLPPWGTGVQVVLLVYAGMLFISGARAYDLQTFLGLRQWYDARAGRTGQPPSFLKTGVLQHVRHPWYSGAMALLWGVPGLTDMGLLIRVILTGYVLIGTFLEERKLHLKHGAAYQAYCKEVPMLIPWRIFQKK